MIPRITLYVNSNVSLPLISEGFDMSVCVSLCRCLQEEQQLRPASLPAIPNPFPELCSPAGSPVLSPIQTSENHVSTPTPTHLHSYKLYTKIKNDNCLEEEGAVERFLNDGLPFSACFGGKKRQQLSVVFELLNNYMDIYLIVFYRVVLYLP